MAEHDDLERVRRCWPHNYVNGATRHVARWCGWTEGEAAARLADAGVEHGEPQGDLGLVFWHRPAGARGLQLVEPGTPLARCGVTRVVRRGDGVAVYCGPAPGALVSAASSLGYAPPPARAYEWRGPEPSLPDAAREREWVRAKRGSLQTELAARWLHSVVELGQWDPTCCAATGGDLWDGCRCPSCEAHRG